MDGGLSCVGVYLLPGSAGVNPTGSFQPVLGPSARHAAAGMRSSSEHKRWCTYLQPQAGFDLPVCFDVRGF